MIYFNNVKNLDELKKKQRQLARKLHPDNGGNTEDFKTMMTEFTALFKRLSRGGGTAGSSASSSDSEESEKKTEKTAADFADDIAETLGKISHLNIDVEVCGSWIWVSGNTYLFRDALKNAGFRWSKSKKAWYWMPGASADDVPHKKRAYCKDLDKVRARWGSEKVHSATAARLA